MGTVCACARATPVCRLDGGVGLHGWGFMGLHGASWGFTGLAGANRACGGTLTGLAAGLAGACGPDSQN